MIVDDQIENIRLLSMVLEVENYTKLVTVQDSRLVVSKYLEHRPALIFLDIKMPYLDGFEVMRQLRLLEDPSPPSIVVVTGLADKEEIVKIQEAGAVVLHKPFMLEELKTLLHRILGKSCSHEL